MAALQTGDGTVAPPGALVTPTALASAPTGTLPQLVPSQTEPVTPIATEVPSTPAAPRPTPDAVATVVLPPNPALDYETRWRTQQLERTVFDPVRVYRTTSSDLWWYDPVNQQSVILGTISGDFLVQAQFVLRSQGRDAFEVPYQVNQSYGLTALSPAVLERIQNAGFGEWIETYIFQAPNVIAR